MGRAAHVGECLESRADSSKRPRVYVDDAGPKGAGPCGASRFRRHHLSHEISPKVTDGGRVLASLCVCGSNQTAAARLPDVRDQ